jgi:aspartyl-tRNA synthetase
VSTWRDTMGGSLGVSNVGDRVALAGWVDGRRDHGGLVFIDLRDESGVVQLVVNPERAPGTVNVAHNLRNEFVIHAVGDVVARAPGLVNPNLATGEIEVQLDQLEILSSSVPLPFQLQDENVDDNVRMRYRWLDLRRPKLQRNIRLRGRMVGAIRRVMEDAGFVDIQTPILWKPTPEGARDFLVPSRLQPGRFYALPQSPQIAKQLLVISGFERYYQIAICFRDEDLRADRQPEFTQIDLEMTFPQQETIFAVVEGFLKAAFAAAGIDLPIPFPRITYDEAMRRYGIDKPDLRLPGLVDLRSAFSESELTTLAIDPALPVIAVRIPKVGELSRKERDDNRPLFDARKGAKLIDDIKRLEKSFPDAVAKVRELVKPDADDLLVLVAGDASTHLKLSDTKSSGRLSEREIAVYSAAGNLRVELARKYADRHQAFAVTENVLASAERHTERHADGSLAFRPIWVTDFPMFEHNEETGKWMPAHHPFTSPHEEDMDRLVSDPASVRSRYYDIAMNGLELGSGSIRIHRQDVQRQIFQALGMTDEEAKERFGFFLEALTYGTPPHGGIALGLDRIAMILAGAPSLREVIAFPKTAKAIDLMVDAPTPVSDAQLRELHIRPVLKG